MRLFLVKPDLMYFEQYNDMMQEWQKSNTRIAPWFLNAPFETLERFADFIKMLDNCENGILEKRFCSTTSYFVIDENDRLVGASSLRHHLTIEGFNTFGHIGFGVRPSERNKGYGTEILNLMITEAKNKKIRNVLLGAESSNTASCKVIEKCSGKFENAVVNPSDSSETINRYWIKIKD